MDNLYYKTLSGCTIWYRKFLGEVRHCIKWIHNDSALILLLIKEVHTKMGCARGVGTYISDVHLAVFLFTKSPKGSGGFYEQLLQVNANAVSNQCQVTSFKHYYEKTGA